VLQPLHILIEAHVLVVERLHGDDTTVPILAKAKRSPGISGPIPAVIVHLAASEGYWLMIPCIVPTGPSRAAE
jgi:hypothetical protein